MMGLDKRTLPQVLADIAKLLQRGYELMTKPAPAPVPIPVRASPRRMAPRPPENHSL